MWIVRHFVGGAAATFAGILVARNNVSTTVTKQVSDMKQSFMRLERQGYQWHSLPGGLDFLSGPKKEDTKTSEDKTKNAQPDAKNKDTAENSRRR